MKPKQVAEYLEYLNKWRRGAEIPQPAPIEIGIFIDEAVKILKEPRFTIKEILKAGEEGEINHFDTEHICNVLMRKII